MEESALPGTAVGQISVRKNVTDHNQPIKFTLGDLSSENTTFHLQSNGTLSLNTVLDREVKDEYKFPVVVVENSAPPKTSKTNVVITVRDINDNVPVFLENGYIAYISENSAIGQGIIQVKASDADQGINAELFYGLESDENEGSSRFTINKTTGLLMVAGK